MSYSKSFTVKRATWLRGESDSLLYRSSDSKMCCLGFYALSCGYNIEDIRDVVSPIQVNDPSKFPELFFDGVGNSQILNHIMNTNDNMYLSDRLKEDALKGAFSDCDIEINFED